MPVFSLIYTTGFLKPEIFGVVFLSICEHKILSGIVLRACGSYRAHIVRRGLVIACILCGYLMLSTYVSV